jgi:hypothetical protein
MSRILCLIVAVATLGFGLTACEQDPGSNVNSSGDPSLGARGTTTTAADPKIAYIEYNNATYKLGVMDTSSANQTLVYTPPSGSVIDRPYWSPSNSVLWAEYPSSGNTTSIRAADISVSGGVAVSSNVRTIHSESDDTARIRFPTWSSTSSVNKIAFACYRGSSGGTPRTSYVCTVSGSGGSLDTFFTVTEGVVQGIAWNGDDSRIAVYTRNGSAGKIVIINASTRLVTDSMTFTDISNYGGLNSLEWSRTGSVNKLAFVLDGMIQYIAPTTGSSPTTQNVGKGSAPITIANYASWSPNNSSIMFIKGTYTSSCQCDKHSLVKNTAQTSTVKDIDKTFEATALSWHR